MLESGKKFSAADMLALQTDIHSEADRFVAERLVYAVDHAHQAFCARQAGCGTYARLGWPHAGIFGRADDRRESHRAN